MADTTDNSNTRLIARIDAVADRLDPEDASVLNYIRSQITVEGLAARGPEDQNVRHLHEVAAQRLKRYESKAPSPSLTEEDIAA